MKILLSESKLKKLIGNRFGLDLTNKIYRITGPYQLPMHWDRYFTPEYLNRTMRIRGPIFLLEYGKSEYLLIPKDESTEEWFIFNIDGEYISEFDFMKKLGVEMLGLSINDLLELYFDENESINEMYNPDDEPNYDVIEKMINKTMSKNFDWWKGLNVYNIRTVNKDYRVGYYFIDGKLLVDRDWGASQWREYHYLKRFPDNYQWEEPDGTYTYFGDIIGGELADEVRKKLLVVLNAFYGRVLNEVTFTSIRLKFE